jgi:hypothetical protein
VVIDFSTTDYLAETKFGGIQNKISATSGFSNEGIRHCETVEIAEDKYQHTPIREI